MPRHWRVQFRKNSEINSPGVLLRDRRSRALFITRERIALFLRYSTTQMVSLLVIGALVDRSEPPYLRERPSDRSTNRSRVQCPSGGRRRAGGQLRQGQRAMSDSRFHAAISPAPEIGWLFPLCPRHWRRRSAMAPSENKKINKGNSRYGKASISAPFPALPRPLLFLRNRCCR